MKKYLYILVLIILCINCTSQKNTEDFISSTQGRYLFNANEVIEIFFKDQILHAKWRGNDDIELLKLNDSSFYMKELNEKMIFVSQPKMHIELSPKTEHKGVKYHFKKIKKDQKTAIEYFKAKEYENALNAYKTIQQQDSLNPTIRERKINRLGYNFIRKNNFDSAIEIFKINVALYPKSSNVYDSLGEAFLLNKDTVNAKTNFKKALSINPENRSANRFLKKITKK